MRSLKEYLLSSNTNTVAHIEKAEQNMVDSVYNEKENPENSVRVWVSFDFNETDKEKYYTKVDDWSKFHYAETWGNSVRTFLWENIFVEPTNDSIAERLVKELIEYELLDGKSFEEKKWQDTENISIYVIYRYKIGKKCGSNHFVLVQNADIPHEEYLEGHFHFEK